jgi:nucleolar protein 58
VEARLQQLEGRELGKSSGAAHGKANIELYDKDRKKENPGVLSAAKVK